MHQAVSASAAFLAALSRQQAVRQRVLQDISAIAVVLGVNGVLTRAQVDIGDTNRPVLVP
jgi:hypothetical protein